MHVYPANKLEQGFETHMDYQRWNTAGGVHKYTH
ncbi:hypothetical protein SRABI06_00396 [Pseudomonas brassicacearum]|nr:hypothetical protein SRABI06_00396 [Pseudomonas brassicacearum]